MFGQNEPKQARSGQITSATTFPKCQLWQALRLLFDRLTGCRNRDDLTLYEHYWAHFERQLGFSFADHTGTREFKCILDLTHFPSSPYYSH